MFKNLEDFKVICRFCARETNQMHLISEIILIRLDDKRKREIMPNDLKEIIQFCLGITISESDELPQQICLTCLEKIVSFEYFKKDCITNVEKLAEIQNQQKTDHFEASSPCFISKIEEIKIEPVEDGTPRIKPENAMSEESQTATNKTVTKELKHYSYQCQICGAMTKSLKQHLTIHTKKDMYKCDYCGKEFTQKGNLQRHFFTHSNDKRYKCELCDKGFTEEKSLKIHLVVHTGERNFCCNLCGKTFGYKHSLSAHKAAHSQNRKFPCKICGKLFLDNSGLTKHTRIHSDEKPYSCDLCEKRFKTKTILTTHFRVHNNEKPYKCSVCKSTFAYRDQLVRHLKNKHNLMPKPSIQLTNTKN